MLKVFMVLVFIATLHNNLYAFELQNLKVNILKGDYKQAIVEGEKGLASQEESREIDELYYLLGLSYLKDANFLRASDIFEIILKEHPDSRFKDEAKFGLADTYLLRSDLDKAKGEYEDLLKNSPATKLKAQAYYRLSQIGFKKGDSNSGKMYLDLLKEEFPTNTELILNRDLYIPAPKPLAIASNESAPIVYYSVQVGAFSSKENAQNLAQKLIQEGHQAYIEDPSTEGSQSFRVRVGKLPSRQEAAELEKKLSLEGYPTKIYP